MLKHTLRKRLATFPDGFRNFGQDIQLSGVPRLKFLRSDWESVDSPSSVVSVPYLLYRLIFFLYFIVFLVLSITGFAGRGYWPLLATNWTFLAQTLYATTNFVNTCSFWIQEKCYRSHPYYHLNVNWFESGIWFFMNLSYSVPQFISITYWLFVHGDSGSDTTVGWSLVVHGINAVLVIFDALIVAAPLNVTHFLYPILINGIYVIFTILYEVAGGTYPYEGKPYIYPILNWREDPGMAAVTGVLSLTCITGFHFLFWVLIQIRIHLSSIYHSSEPNSVYNSNEDFSNNHNDSPEDKDNEKRPLLDKSHIIRQKV